jgi:hypothetical protein
VGREAEIELFRNMRRSPEADFEVGGQGYSVFSHDWRVEPASAWLQLKAERYPQTDLTLAELEASLPPPLLVLSQPKFEVAVRQALRDYTRPDLLAANPLMRSRPVILNHMPPLRHGAVAGRFACFSQLSGAGGG